YPGSGLAFAEIVDGWSFELDNEILFGHRIPDPLPKLTVAKLSPGELPDTLAMAGSGILVAAELMGPLERAAGEHIQFVPVGIYPGPPYNLVNVLTLVPCMDRERSKYEPYDEPPHAIRKLSKLVLLPVPRDAPAIFRIKEIPGVIMVRDDLRKAMEKV